MLEVKHRETQWLLILAVAFNAIVMVANVVGHKPVQINWLIVSAGSMIFPLTYLITAIITEVFGRQKANQVILMGLASNIFAAAFISLTVIMPHPDFWDKQQAFDVVMSSTIKIFLLSSFAYILSEFTNLFIFSWVSIKLKNNYFLLRVVFSTFIAVTLDTLCLLPIILGSSPSAKIVAVKLASLVIFKLLFVTIGLFLTVRLKDIIKSEEHKLSEKAKVKQYCKQTRAINKIDSTNVEPIFGKKYARK